METREHALSYVVAGTAASAFHVSDTVDWSSLSAQVKNRVVVVDVPVVAPERVEPSDSPHLGNSIKPISDLVKRDHNNSK